jgi:hypothetical protein
MPPPVTSFALLGDLMDLRRAAPTGCSSGDLERGAMGGDNRWGGRGDGEQPHGGMAKAEMPTADWYGDGR